MWIVFAFWAAFGTTVALLATSLWTGWTGRRRLHLRLAPTALVVLAVTIVLTERLASVRHFPPQEMEIHLWFAKIGAALALPVLVTGLVLIRRPGWRRAHRVCVLLFLTGVLVATGTGIWVFSLSTPA